MNRSYGQVRPPKYLVIKLARTDYIAEGPAGIDRNNPDIWNRSRLLSSSSLDLDEDEAAQLKLDNSSILPLLDSLPDHSNDPNIFAFKIKYDLPNLPDTFTLETPRNCIQNLGTMCESFEFNSALSISRQIEYGFKLSECTSCCLWYRDDHVVANTFNGSVRKNGKPGTNMPYSIQTSDFIQCNGRDVLNYCYAKFGGSENLYNKIDKNRQNEYDFKLHLNYKKIADKSDSDYDIIRGTIFSEDIQNLRAGRDFAVFYWYCGNNLDLVWNHQLNSYIYKMEVSPIFSLLK